MSKIIQISLAVLLAISLVGCGTNRDSNDPAKNEVQNNATKPSTDKNVTTEEKTTKGNDDKLKLANDVAEKITEMKEVDTATAIVFDKNAYVAVMLKEGTKGNKEIEKKIADLAKEIDTNLKNVYVSLNPDVVKQMNDYRDKINANEPIEGIFKEFSDMVKRVFPTAH
ncbi:YhcN/YlaJ family sporulation lipoprotein [Viridibacillus sp. NPDC096237]|uniref:YhcN/YlaJ family sporulation lipoprotein n=1 Tax=Viridibacillus sp. NPDC096237 TaxID=3390721 RepID=UPI003CFD3E74